MFCDICAMQWWIIFHKLLSVVHLGALNWLGFAVKGQRPELSASSSYNYLLWFLICKHLLPTVVFLDFMITDD